MTNSHKNIPKLKKYSTLIRFGVGFTALFIGSLEYFLSRPAESSHIGRIVNEIFGELPLKANIFGVFSGVIPDFVHPFSFSLLTMALFPLAEKKTRAAICIFWLIVDLFFEIGQGFGRNIAGFLLNIFPQSSFSKILANYFTAGTFDHFDILAIFLGIITAYIIGELTSPHVESCPSKPESGRR